MSQASARAAAHRQVVKEEAAAETVYQAGRRGLPEVIVAWAAGLTPQNAPKEKDKGPLAWVRETEVPKLIAALAKEGYR